MPQYTSQEFSWAKLPKTQRLAVGRKLYAEAGYGPGKELKVELRPGDSEARQKIAQARASQWKEALGLEARVASGSDEKAPEDPEVGVLLTQKDWVDTATGEVVNETLAHEGESVREFYAKLPSPVRVGIEATGSMKRKQPELVGGDTSETTQRRRRDSPAMGKVCSWAEKIGIKSLETVGVVRDNAVTGS